MKSSGHSGTPSLECPATSSPQFPVAPSLLRVFAGSKERHRSCGDDVEDEVVVELDDSPGTTKRTKFSVSAEGLLPSFGSDVARDHWDTHKCKPCSLQRLPRDNTAGVSSSNWTVTKLEDDDAPTLALLHSFGPPLWAVTTDMGFLDLLRVTNSPELKVLLT